MMVGIYSINRVHASNYTHNQMYYDQPAYRTSGLARIFQPYHPMDQYWKTTASGIAGILDSARSLKSSAEGLIKPNISSFQSRTAVSSDGKSVIGKAGPGAAIKSYQVRVDQTATSQYNSGTFLKKDNITSLQSGTNQWDITVGDKTTTVSAFIYSNDTNESALNKMKNAINDANAGVTASMAYDAKTGEQKLELRSSQTGMKNAFTVTDITGNAAATAGISNIVSAATDARYSINGGAVQTFSSNTVELEKDKVTANLLKATTGTVEIEVKPDESEVLDQVKQLIRDYNGLIGGVRGAGAYLNSSVKRTLENAVAGFGPIGIAKNADGTLELDENKFKESLQDRFEYTKDAVTGSFGFAGKLEKAADRISSQQPSSMINPRIREFQLFAAYQAAAGSYFQMPMNGLLYDGFF